MKIDKKLIKELSEYLDEFKLTEIEFTEKDTKIKVSKNNEQKLNQNSTTSKIFLNNGKAYKFEEIFKNIPLADTLKLIANKGANGFYCDYVAKDMVESLQSLGGLHTLEDFKKQKKTICNYSWMCCPS